jgi:hypothetical protein
VYTFFQKVTVLAITKREMYLIEITCRVRKDFYWNSCRKKCADRRFFCISWQTISGNTQYILHLSHFISHQDRPKLCPITYTLCKIIVFKIKHKLTVNAPAHSPLLRFGGAVPCYVSGDFRWFPLLIIQKELWWPNFWMLRLSEVRPQGIER